MDESGRHAGPLADNVPRFFNRVARRPRYQLSTTNYQLIGKNVQNM